MKRKGTQLLRDESQFRLSVRTRITGVFSFLALAGIAMLAIQTRVNKHD